MMLSQLLLILLHRYKTFLTKYIVSFFELHEGSYQYFFIYLTILSSIHYTTRKRVKMFRGTIFQDAKMSFISKSENELFRSAA